MVWLFSCLLVWDRLSESITHRSEGNVDRDYVVPPPAGTAFRSIHPRRALQPTRLRKVSTVADTPPPTTRSSTVREPGNRGRPGYSREQIIRIAVAEFNAHGYEATSMGKLADRLGITKSAIYHHVSSKEEILVEATDHAMSELTAALDDAATIDGDSREQLRAAIFGAATVLCANPDEVTLLVRLRGNTEVEQEIMERRRSITRDFISYVRGAQEDGLVRSDIDAALAGRLTLGTINSITEWYRPEGLLQADDLAAAVTSMVMEGLAKRS